MKTTLNTVSGGYNLQVINDNFTKIEDALENGVLWRDNPVGEPNQLESDIDANSKRIYNLPIPESNTDAARIQDVNEAIALVTTTGDSAALALDLANSVDAAKGANKVGFNYSLTYSVGTIGRWLKDNVVRLTDLAASSGASIVGFISSGVGAVARTLQAVLRELPVSVNHFGADPTGVLDSTAAFVAAQVVSKELRIPPGTYKLNNFALLNGTVLRGAGKRLTFITQSVDGSPAISVTTSTVTGNYQSIEASDFTINGSASPTVAAFQVSCSGAGALWRCKFDFAAQNTYQAFNVTSIGTNFFDNEVSIDSEGTTTTAAYFQSGTYNRLRLFLTNCNNSIALDHGGVNDTIWVVTDGQIKDSGLNTTFINPTVENLQGTSLTVGESVISLTGTNQVLINPTVILPIGSAVKCTYAFKPSNGTVFQNPYITSFGGATLANPFDVNAGVKWVLIGGKSDCTNKIETIYNGTDDNKSLRNVTMLGDVSQLSTSGNTHGGKVTQYLAPTAPFSMDVNPNTDVIVLEPTVPIANPQFNLIYGLVDGRVVTLTSTQNLTGAINWVSTANVTQLPATLTAGVPLSFVYRATQNKFYKV